jgi:hypothetical protein
LKKLRLLIPACNSWFPNAAYTPYFGFIFRNVCSKHIVQALDMFNGFAHGVIITVPVALSNTNQQHGTDQKYRCAPCDSFAAAKTDHKLPPMDSHVHCAGACKGKSHPLMKILDTVDVEQHQDARNGYNRKCKDYDWTDTRPQGGLGDHLCSPLSSDQDPCRKRSIAIMSQSAYLANESVFFVL